MIVDTSALIAILFDEPESRLFSRIISEAPVCRISVVTRLELAIVLDRQAEPDAARQAEFYLRRAGIVEEPVTLDQSHIAMRAFYDYGNGHHPAKLNFGDCFVYALAKAMKEPLLYKGSDFAQTDVTAAYRSE